MSGWDRSTSAARDGPLTGLRIVLTRPREQAGGFERSVVALGGRPEIAPAIAIAPPTSWNAFDTELDRIDQFDWIAFTSANAVSAFTHRARTRGVPPLQIAAPKLAVVGQATAAALAKELRAPDAISETASAEGLGESLPIERGARVLLAHGDLAGPALADALRHRGARPTEVVAYRTVPGDGIPSIVAGLREGTIDALLFASGSAVRFVAGALAARGDLGDRTELTVRPAIFCIGPSTAEAAALAGFAPDGIAAAATQEALTEEMIRWFVARGSGSA